LRARRGGWRGATKENIPRGSSTVRAHPYPQIVQGVVRNNGAGVSNALVALLDANAANFRVIAGGRSDGLGNFSVQAPPGSYQIIASKLGYIGDFVHAPKFALAANATLTTNIDLATASSLLNGALLDSANPAIRVMPCAQLLAFSSNSLFAIGIADTNGNFSIPVTANNVWTVRPADQSAIAAGYLTLDPAFESHFETFDGPVTGAAIFARRATALLYGHVIDNHGDPIPGISLTASGDGGLYDEAAVSDGSGAYAMAMDPGGDFVQVANATEPPASSFLFGGARFFVDDGQALPLDIVGNIATARFEHLLP